MLKQMNLPKKLPSLFFRVCWFLLFIGMSTSSWSQNNIAYALGTPAAADQFLQNIYKQFGVHPDSIQIAASKEVPMIMGFFDKEKNKPVLLYKAGFVESMEHLKIEEEYWIKMGLILHEVGHHVLDHRFDRGRANDEHTLGADRWSGGALYTFGADLFEAQLGIKSRFVGIYEVSTVKKSRRLKALKEGYQTAKEKDKKVALKKAAELRAISERNANSVSITDKDGNLYSFKTLKDGKRWLGRNLRVNVPGSYCYDNDSTNCRLYGRLYNWEAAKEACASLGDGWRLPKDKDWRKMASAYELDIDRADVKEGVKGPYNALLKGGITGMDLLLGGRRNEDGSYSFLGISGDYWSSSENSVDNAWYFHFDSELTGRMYRYDLGKVGGRSCRCIQD